MKQEAQEISTKTGIQGIKADFSGNYGQNEKKKKWDTSFRLCMLWKYKQTWDFEKDINKVKALNRYCMWK